ncbi:MAG: SusC/RagA family TonB-linked outer membrane protein [Bacteroidetes bacterium]|nr:MAG: SusC/RagA family TonB-linked outer membrane protein [Bacteroidota bacterium]
MRKLVLMATGLLLFAAQLWAQTTSTGVVTDAKTGQPLPGVSVTGIGSKVGAKTDNLGTFSITVPAGVKNLQFSYVGYKTISQAVSAGNMAVGMTLAESSLDEVVVTGFGSQKRKDVTASISTIGGDKIKNIPVQSFEQALSGKAAGLNVTLPNGVLGNPPVVRIRGVNSIQGSSAPLVVIDGVPVFTGDLSSNLSANNALGNLNPADIEDIQILKDGAASAIYGSRAANGVMLITTKKGKAGKAKVSYDAWVGWTEPFNLFEVLNAQQYVEYKNEAVRNQPGPVFSGHVPGTPVFFLDTDASGKAVDTKWADQLYQTGFQHNHNLSVSGANDNTKYFFSANYTNQEGMIQTNTFDRMQMRMNLDQKVNKWLTIGGNFNFSRGATFSPSTGSIPGTPFNTSGLARLAFITAPNVSPYAADGRYNIMGIDNPTQRNSFNQIGRNRNLFNSGLVNPVMVRDLNKISSTIDQLQGNLFAELKLMKGLSFRTQYGVSWQTSDDRVFYNSLHGDGIQNTSTTGDDGQAFNVTGKFNVANFQNFLTYNFSFNPPGNLITENYLISYFGRVNYNFKNRYYLGLTARTDEYSAFSQGNKRGNFYGASLGWNVSDEAFWDGLRNTVSFFKLRGSYGQVGSLSAVGNFGSLSTFSAFQYGLGYPTLQFNQAGNRDLRWENSTKLDVGFSFGLWNDRINGEFSYYNTDLDDLILDRPLPSSMGVPGNTIQANAGSMFNRGVELTLNARIVEKRDFSWTASFNITTQKNEVTALAPGVTELIGTTQLERTNITRVGQPIGSFFVVRSNGVDPQTGQRIFLDGRGREVLFNFADPVASRWKYRDGTIAPPVSIVSDGVVSGSALPTYYGGFSNNFFFKGFDLNVDFFYSGGNKVYFGSRAGLFDQRFWNNTPEVLNRWQKPGDVTNVPRPVFGDNFSNGSAFPMDINLFDAGFVRCRTIALGYTVPAKLVQKANLSSVRFYAQALNPFIITNYPGIDPEISVNGNSALTPGVDRNTVGQARTYTFGLNIGF